jgi:hypothetical protein
MSLQLILAPILLRKKKASCLQDLLLYIGSSTFFTGPSPLFFGVAEPGPWFTCPGSSFLSVTSQGSWVLHCKLLTLGKQAVGQLFLVFPQG